MDYRKVTAIVRRESLEKVENRLKEFGVNGISVGQVKGFGEYANFFRHDWMVTYTRIEIFAERSRAEEIARIIADTAHTGLAGDGIVALLPVEKIFRIRTLSEPTSKDEVP